MKDNILIITDTCGRELLAMKELEARITDSNIPGCVFFDFRKNIIDTKHIEIRFHAIDSAKMVQRDRFTVGYSMFMLENPVSTMILANIKRWKKIEEIVRHMPQSAEDIPFKEITKFIEEYKKED